MDNIKFEEGFHLTPGAMTFLQAAYQDPIKGITKNDNANSYIVSGCRVSNGKVSDGYVVIEGQIFPFKGGDYSNYVVLNEEVGYNNNQNGTSVPAYYHYYASCSEEADPNLAIPFASLLRLRSKIAPSATAWERLPVLEGFTASDYAALRYETIPLQKNPRWRITDDGKLMISGMVRRDDTKTFRDAFLQFPFALPSEVKFSAICDANSAETAYNAFVTIGQNGSVYISDSDVNANDIGAINRVKFPDIVINL